MAKIYFEVIFRYLSRTSGNTLTGQPMHTRNSNQALFKSQVRRVTSPGNLLGRKNISVADKFVATHTHTHIQGTASQIYTDHCSPHTYRLLSARARARTHTHTHTGHCIPHTQRLLSVYTYRPLQSVHLQVIECTYI